MIAGELATVASELPSLDRQSDSLGLVDWLAIGVGNVQVIDTMCDGVRVSEMVGTGLLRPT